MTCKVCNDTGDMGSGYLDCYHCPAAELKMLDKRFEEVTRDYVRECRQITERKAELSATIKEAA